MVKHKERGGRRQILQLHEEKEPSKEHCLAQMSDSSEGSDEEGSSSQDNKGKDVIDEQVADFLKEIDAIPTEADPKQMNDVASTASVEVDAVYKDGNGKNGVYPQDDDFMCAWQQCQDESTGYAYYWNLETNEVTWECPAEYKWRKPVTIDTATNSATVQSEKESYEGKIIPITSYGSSDESSDEDDPTPLRRTSQSRSKQSCSRAIASSSPCEYGPQLPVGQPPPNGSAVQCCQLPPVDEILPREEVVYGPQIPFEALPETSGNGSEADSSYEPRLDDSVEDKPLLPLEEENLGRYVEDAPHPCMSIEHLSETDSVPSTSDLGADLPSQEGVTSAHGALIDYPSSPVDEDTESEHATCSPSSASSVLINYPMMVGKADELTTEGAEPDSTRASQLVSYGESDSEEDTSEPAALLSHDVDLDSAEQPPTEKDTFVDVTTSIVRHGGYCRGKDSKIVTRKKQLMSVRFVKSDKVFYLSKADKEEKRKEPIDVQESDDDFDDVLQALDDALMESKKKKAADDSNKDLSRRAWQESSDGSASPQQDTMIDSHAIIRIGGGDYSDKIEASLAIIMAKLAHLRDIGSLDDTIRRDLSVQVETRTQDWRAGALDPKYCWKKLQEVHDALVLREGSLPCGWSCHWDSGAMRYFYTDDSTGRSQWQFPSANSQSPKETEAFEQPSTPSTVETSTVSSAVSAAALSPSASRGEKRKGSLETCIEELPTRNVVSDTTQPLAASLTDTQPPEPVDDERQPSRSAEEPVAGTWKRKKTKLSSGLALRKKNIPSLLQKWEKIKKEQQRENLKQNLQQHLS